jgi:hypothetical protein
LSLGRGKTLYYAFCCCCFAILKNVTSIFLGGNYSQENVKTWRPLWYHKQKKLGGYDVTCNRRILTDKTKCFWS